MEYLYQDLNIPRKQIAETTTKNRFKSIVHKQFLKNLVKYQRLSSFPAYPHVIDEWPQQKDLGSNWEQVYIVVSDKRKHQIFVEKLFFFLLLVAQKTQPESDSASKIQE